MEFSDRLAMTELLIWSSLGAFHFDVCLMICCIIAEVVKQWLMGADSNVTMQVVTLGRSMPGFVVNCFSNLFANSFTFSLTAYTSPCGPLSG